MRTYSRKPLAGQMIKGVEDLCRLCLNESDDKVPIFAEDSSSVCTALAIRIMICVGLEMANDDCLPNSICSDCHRELERCYAFRKKCEVSYQKLKSHLLAVRAEEYKKEQAQKNVSAKDCNDVVEPKQLVFEVSTGGIQLSEETKENNVYTSLVNLINKNPEPMESSVPVNNKIVLNNKIVCNDIALDRIDSENQECLTERSELVAETNILHVENEDVANSNDFKSGKQSPDISMFLSSILIELGILRRQDDGLVVADDTRTIELEMGDGEQVTLDLTEEDEQNSISKLPVENDKTKDIVIQYITSDSKANDTVDWNKMRGSAQCSECGRGFASRSAAARHWRAVHARARPHACRHCGRAFAQREVLRRHELVHSEERPFQCSQCGKGFTQRGALVAHTRSHAPPHARPLALHRCTRCPKVFLHSSGLSRHLMMHNGRIFLCGGCERQFRDKSSLMRHLRNTNHDPPATANT